MPVRATSPPSERRKSEGGSAYPGNIPHLEKGGRVRERVPVRATSLPREGWVRVREGAGLGLGKGRG